MPMATGIETYQVEKSALSLPEGGSKPSISTESLTTVKSSVMCVSSDDYSGVYHESEMQWIAHPFLRCR